MNRILYHGSSNIIEKPIFGIGNHHNDYGLGFYCCANIELARQCASRTSGNGFVNKYHLRDDRLSILDLTSGDYNNVLVWIALLMKNRTITQNLQKQYKRELDYLFNNYLIDTKRYDVIIGYRADDAYFKFPESFIRSQITIDSLNKIYKAGDLGKQYVLMSQRAFNLIKFDGYELSDITDKEEYYKRKSQADKKYSELIEKSRYVKGERLIDLVSDHV
ncbi:MAG: DUF3990 domain-containing protein [Erysipelotrichaceae bacterium]|nr:DUF3990 domain-containing protein [Erysipelotrichaceae bacterium]